MWFYNLILKKTIPNGTVVPSQDKTQMWIMTLAGGQEDQEEE